MLIVGDVAVQWCDAVLENAVAGKDVIGRKWESEKVGKMKTRKSHAKLAKDAKNLRARETTDEHG